MDRFHWCYSLPLLLIFLSDKFLGLHMIIMATSRTHPDDISGLQHLKNGFDPVSIRAGSCLISWNFSFDPCDHIFSDQFTCGFRCDLIVFGSYRVTEIALDQAGYSGSLSAAVFTLPYLQTLDLSYNSLSGSIPVSLSNLTLLHRLILSGNLFAGSIPFSLGSLSRLRELYLDDNRFTGSIPASFRRLASLERLELQRNILTGELPDLSQLRNLYYLDVSDNRISGGAPTTFPPSVIEISLRNNSLRGHLNFRLRLSELKLLQVLDLSHNQLTGAIPSSLFHHPSLQQLTISHNNFTSIESPPHGGGSTASRLVAVDLSYNDLHGLLPPFMAAIPKLSSLSLEQNKLTGIIPNPYAKKAAFPQPGTASFQRLLLGGNYLYGLIPGQFLALKPGSINMSLADNCLYMCPNSFYFCRGGNQKSWQDCKRLYPTVF
ncbi:LRR receptor-like serine/threonine-protein kinase ERL2 [Andrographis paniculata]|uniref:LRR receptor-like serine/threonine-protein kinase ERL2 n=1 Tax=Andrographis paniculata TaxID=175694 RepID=UPI0021E73936|nr:LRR receptor-like serine/threonine-protein kinase ERL2 [Andrographis paniculata]